MWRLPVRIDCALQTPQKRAVAEIRELPRSPTERLRCVNLALKFSQCSQSSLVLGLGTYGRTFSMFNTAAEWGVPTRASRTKP